MNLALNTVASRLSRWRRGNLRVLTELENVTFPRVTPARLFPRIGQLRLGGSPARQLTGQTCGTTVVALVNSLFDPALLAHLRATDLADALPADRSRAARERFGQVQQDLLRAVTGRTWPSALGTPPWGMVRELRVPGVSYRHLPVNDADVPLMETLLPTLRRAVGAGLPVPLYVGGSTGDRLAAAVPRHVVLLVPPAATAPAISANSHARIFEPASGKVFRRRWSDLARRSAPDPALGGWTHLAWVVLPGGTPAVTGPSGATPSSSR